ncbi:hypothetical protein CF386_08485 [Paraphotobacterium marinum]|uniref:HTH LytTR-type domain-containing protein n=1 Tax=Paraphotobacterium marinum TaxID=1755811 RepID=A0A220VFG3_9GAMM|nr:LytTR family DNA-binding domain-containing protein [Paraphotobacterium marinum]ASK79097.1 hypothetical protein CF386_08485 [Paraphotobacterium marinum]
MFIIINKLFLINLIFHPELNAKLQLNLWDYWKFIFQAITFPLSRFTSDPWTAIIALITSVSRDPLFICIFAFGIRFLNKGEFYIYTGEMLQKLNIKKNKTVKLKEENLLEGTENTLKESFTNSQIKLNNRKAQAILVRKNDEELLIHCDDIFSVEAAGNYMNLDNGQEIFSIYTTTEGILSQLPQNFKKIHRSSIINFDKVVSIRSESTKNKMAIILENNKEYLVARSYQQMVKSYFKNISLLNKS